MSPAPLPGIASRHITGTRSGGTIPTTLDTSQDQAAATTRSRPSVTSVVGEGPPAQFYAKGRREGRRQQQRGATARRYAAVRKRRPAEGGPERAGGTRSPDAGHARRLRYRQAAPKP